MNNHIREYQQIVLGLGLPDDYIYKVEMISDKD